MTEPRTEDAPPVPEGSPDRVLADRYRLQHRLGAGAMGVVWLAADERLQRPVAVKQLWPSTPDPSQDHEARARALREGRIAARLRHPHVVTVHDVAEHNGQPVLVMEYVPSRSLATVLLEQGPLPPHTVARFGAQAASALAAAHAAGIVHRDIKPGNLLVGDDGTLKIADFGISHAPGDVTISRSGAVAGTPAYLAPEIARGHRPSPESDIFSLGSTLYTAVEGVPAFGEDGDDPLVVLRRVAAADFPPPGQAGPLTPVLAAMMRPDPEARPTAGQLTAALSAVAERRPLDPATLDPAAGRTHPVLHLAAAGTMTGPMPAVQTAGGGTRLDSQPVPEETGPEEWATQDSGRRFALPAWLGRYRRYLLPGGGVLAAALAVAILAGQLSAPSAPAPNGTATPATTPAPTAANPDLLTRAVSAYYELLPSDPDTAWNSLGPALQAQGKDAYRSYWASIDTLTMTSPPQVTGATTVSIGLELRTADGKVVDETHQLTLDMTGSTPLILSDTLLTAATISSVPPSSSSPPAPPPGPAPVPATPPAPVAAQPTKGHGHKHGG